MSRPRFVAFAFSIILFSIVLRILIPVWPLYGSAHDDQLMVFLAHQILQGNWLGSYQEMGHSTLSKPPGYPMFLAVAHFIPWAPTITVHLVLLFGIILVTREFRKLAMSREASLVFLGFSAFAPFWFSEQMSRIYRDGFLASLTFLIIGLSLTTNRLLAASVVTRDKFTCFKATSVILSNGVALAWFYLTKPSWHAIFFFSVTVSLIAIIRIKTIKRFDRVVVISLTILLLSAPTLIFSFSVEKMNESKFGVSQIDSFANGEFPRALKLIYGIKDNQDRKYVDVNAEMRAKLYSISPTAKKLEPFLERTDGIGWRPEACNSALKICDESAAWFPWDIRNAVGDAGLGSSAKDFEETFRVIANDLERACSSKRIKCEAQGLAPGLDSINSLSKRDFFDALSLSFLIAMSTDTGNTGRGNVWVTDESVFKKWNETVSGLPKIIESNTYEPNNAILGDTRKLLATPYSPIWPLLMVLGAIGVLVQVRSREPVDVAITLRWLAVISFMSFGVMSSQLALLDASSGLYMQGGALYLLPAFPFQILFVVAGIWRLSIWIKNDKSFGKL